MELNKEYRRSELHKYLTMGASVFVAVLLAMLWAPQVRADSFDGYNIGTSDDYAVLYSNGGSASLQMTSDSGVTGNVGIGGTATSGTIQLSGGTITGNLDFQGAVPSGKPWGGTITGTVTGGVAAVGTDLTDLATLSSTLAGETNQTMVSVMGSTSYLLCASDVTCTGGTKGAANADGTSVFDVTALNPGNGHTITISGTASDYVVLNIDESVMFSSAIVLTGGITADHVLYNIEGTSTLQFAANDATVYGIFLDLGGTINANSVNIGSATGNGYLWGGDSVNLGIVSQAYVDSTPPSGTPEPSSLMLMGIGLLGLGLVLRTRNAESDGDEWPVAQA